MITWNKAVRCIWGLPQDSRTMLLAGLNKGKHAWDIIFNRFIGMVYSMVRSKNEKLSLIALSGLEDKRSIIAQNVDKIRCNWKIRGNIADIAKMKDKCAIYRDNKDGFVSRTQMVKELRGALQGGIEIESSQGGYC